MIHNEAKRTPVAEFTKPVLTNRKCFQQACLDVLKANPSKKYTISELYYMAIQAGLGRPKAQSTLYNTATNLRKLGLAQLKHDISTFSWIPNQNTVVEMDSYDDSSNDDTDDDEYEDNDSDQEMPSSSHSLDLVSQIASLEASIEQQHQQVQKLQVSIADKKAKVEQAKRKCTTSDYHLLSTLSRMVVCSPIQGINESCSVCQETFSNTFSVITACSHRFHIECISAWIAQAHYSCPVCRQDICIQHE